MSALTEPAPDLGLLQRLVQQTLDQVKLVRDENRGLRRRMSSVERRLVGFDARFASIDEAILGLRDDFDALIERLDKSS